MSIWSRMKKQSERTHKQSIKERETIIEGSSERYCRSDMYRFPAGEDLHFVYSSFNRSAHILPSHILHLLDGCSTFKPISDHIQDYLYANPNLAQIDRIQGQLSELASAGLLVSYTELLEYCQRATTSSPPTHRPLKIQSVGVVTRNRIGTLQNCLSSYIENVKRHGRIADFIVMDDSPESDVQRRTRQMLAALKTTYDVDICYGSLQDKSRFAAALVAAGDLPSDVVDFALFDTEGIHYSVGANRNALMLDTIGDMVFSVDDDTKCHLTVAPNTAEELTFDSTDDFMKFWFYKNRDSALQVNPSVDKDVLGIHEQLLGRDLNSCILANAHATARLFDQINHRHIRDLQSGRGTVLATFMGIMGDSAMPAPVSYLLLKGDARKRLVGSEAGYSSALMSREVLRVANRVVIDANAWCVTTAYGYDNQDFLPPFMPVGRGEDDIFGFTLQSCFESAYLGYLPCAILHSPPEDRFYQSSDITNFASRLRMCTLILACVTSFNEWPGLTTDKEKLERMGKYFMELGSLAQQDFDEFLRVQLLRMNSDNISFIENLLQKYERSPKFWANDVEDYVNVLRTSLTEGAYTVPHDIPDSRGIDEGRKLSQRLVYKFGQLLYWWRAIRDTGQRLKTEGIKLATAVESPPL